MSEIVELPHELLLRKYNLQMSELSPHTQQLKKDLDKTITLIVNKSKNGEVNITPSTQSKIDTYDRYICDGIFEYLEDESRITNAQSNAEEKSMDAKRDAISNNATNNNQQSNEQQSNEQPKSNAKIGFWNWE